MSKFIEQSRAVLSSYLSSVAYIDDEIFVGEQVHVDAHTLVFPTRESVAEHDNDDSDVAPKIPRTGRQGVDPSQLTKSFAKIGVQCALLQYASEDDFDPIIKTIKKSDIVILDWQMKQDNGEAAIKILQSFSKELKDGMHLFIVWTADSEHKLKEIGERIASEVSPTSIDEGSTQLFYNYSRVIVCRRTVDSDNNSGISPDKLPEFIVGTFLAMTSGIVSNTLLKSISLLRQYSAKLLSLYNNNIDPAYLEHRAMCPNPEDSENLLANMIIDSFSSIVKEKQISKYCGSNAVSEWIAEKQIGNVDIKISKKDKKTLTSEEIKKWANEGYTSLFGNETEQTEQFERYYLAKAAGTVFQAEKQNRNAFSKLTFEKTKFTESYIHVLSLGSVVSYKDGDSTAYYICIQQRCDSVRIPANKDGRAFLFLPIEQPPSKSGPKENNLIIENVLYSVNTHSYSLKIFYFTPSDHNNGLVVANENGEFKSVCGKSFKWMYDLKDLHAQRIAQKYASELSRVGLDESEHLRRNYLG